MRRNPTPTQEALWALARQRRLGPKFRRWALVQGGSAFLFAPALMLIVEVDEPVHARARAQRIRDAKREAYLKQLGYAVLRLKSEVVLRARSDVVRELRAIITRRCVELGR